MNSGPFWLANINSESVSISLVTYENKYRISTIGPDAGYQHDPLQFTKAVDSSLSAAAEEAQLSSDQEPNTIALVIPPSWIGMDGKISNTKLTLFENMFRDLKLRPMGFISYDDAIAEANNQIEGYLSSFVLVNFQNQEMQVSLVYLGKVIERVEKNIMGEFGSVLLEQALLDLKTESTLPPQIIVTGTYSDNTLSSIKAHPWVGRRDVETFLHFPDIRAYNHSELTNIFLQAVSSQFDNRPISSSQPKAQPKTESGSQPPDNEIEVVMPASEVDAAKKMADVSVDESNLTEVDPEELGFAQIDSNFAVVENNQPSPNDSRIEAVVDTQPRIKINFPKVRLGFPVIPKFKFKFFLILLTLSPLLILIPFFFSKAEITLFVTPYNFQKTLTATFDPMVAEVDLNKGVFPVLSTVKELATSVSLPTTGQKTIGDKSTGEVVIFNKTDKPFNLNKGSVITDQNGLKFELETAVQVASSSSNFLLGVINLGQTKAMVRAADIGPEYNLENGAMMKFKDYPESSLVAKINSNLVGGNRRQIRAVSSTDKSSLDSKLSDAIGVTASQYLESPSSKVSGYIPELTQTKRGRIEYNREIGEEADELTATVTTTITTFSLNDSQKSKIIKALFSSEPDFNNVVTTYNNFSLTIQPKNQATITARYLPKVDLTAVAKMVSGKSQSTAASLIKKNIRRVYNYQITTNLKPISFINPLPFRTENIIINIK